MAYLPLSTANLPDPAIDPAQGSSPQDYFGTLLWTGTGGSRTIADGESGVVGDVNFTPDFSWIKSRSLAASHSLYDAVRTAGERLASDSTGAGGSNSAFGYLSSFTDGGFGVTTGTDGTNPDFYTNESSETYVAWNWKANGSGVSNTDGDFAVTVSANTESGFSIVDLTDPNTGASYEVGHGLDSPPEMFFIKKTNTTSDWSVYHKDVGNDRRLVLNDLGGQSGSSSVYFGSTTPTSSVVTIGSGLSTGDDWIMYCFHSVEGFSKFGSYQGNNLGGNDGPFVYLGFQPALVILKYTGSSNGWFMFDNAREPNNHKDQFIMADMDAFTTEYTQAARGIDFVSNGFKLRTDAAFDPNASGTYIYMAFAENPFKYSNAR